MLLYVHLFEETSSCYEKIQKTTNQRLLMDLYAAGEAYGASENTQMGLVRTLKNPADGIYKVKDNGALRNLNIPETENLPREQWLD